MNFRVTHITRYLYSDPVGVCWNEACLLPRETERQRCITTTLQIEPTPSDLRERKDFFGNRITHFSIQHPHGQLLVKAVSDVVITPATNSFAEGNQPTWETVQARLVKERTPAIIDALSYRYDSSLIAVGPQLADYAKVSFLPERPIIEATADLMRRIYHDFTYDAKATTIATPLSEVLENRRGVCQDFAHLGIGCLRAIGLAARYVSGYIETVPPEGKERLVGADASHAWFSVYGAETGWVDFDPTNNQIPSDQHITVAWGRDFSDVSPLRGVALGGGKHTVEVSVDVARIPAGQTQFQSQGL